jgi:hypothetical protein
MHPNSLFVSWAHFVPSYVRSEIKKKMGLIVDENGNVVEKLEGGQGDNLNDRLLNRSGDKIEKKEQKNFTPISNYKPTGNFVYDPEFFEKLGKKISD